MLENRQEKKLVVGAITGTGVSVLLFLLQVVKVLLVKPGGVVAEVIWSGVWIVIVIVWGWYTVKQTWRKIKFNEPMIVWSAIPFAFVGAGSLGAVGQEIIGGYVGWAVGLFVGGIAGGVLGVIVLGENADAPDS